MADIFVISQISENFSKFDFSAIFKKILNFFLTLRFLKAQPSYTQVCLHITTPSSPYNNLLPVHITTSSDLYNNPLCSSQLEERGFVDKPITTPSRYSQQEERFCEQSFRIIILHAFFIFLLVHNRPGSYTSS